MNRPLRVVFVGMKRPPTDMPDDYWPTFVQFHLELPFYFARYANCDVDLTTVSPVDYSLDFSLAGGGLLRCLTEGQFCDPAFDEMGQPYDVAVHWRKWDESLYVPGARNVILSQDHSYSPEWKDTVRSAFDRGKLDGILCFQSWHRDRLQHELEGVLPSVRLYEGMTLGVDTSVYHPVDKDPYHLLWASDPGRGLDQLIDPFLRLWSKDRRFHLTVTYPDYVRPESMARFAGFLRHPGVTHRPSLRNGHQLWDLFNNAGFLPYSSTFPEPSSRCHRQAQAAGSVVLYPPDMGTPSRLIQHNETGLLEHPDVWADMIYDLVRSGRWEDIGANARNFAVSEDWAVQTARFHSFFSKGIE